MSIAQPSVTALSPRRRSSTVSSARVFAKCSAWPASWKSALQSSGPPIGWMTSMTLPGTSIGAQNARGVLFGRSSTSRWMFSCAWRSMPRSRERRLERGEHPVAREDVVPLVRAEDARDVPPLCLVEADADTRAQQLVRRVFVQRLRRVEEGAALRGEVVELGSRTS